MSHRAAVERIQAVSEHGNRFHCKRHGTCCIIAAYPISGAST